MNRLAWRSTPALVRAAIGLVALLLVLVAALQGDAATTLVVGVLALLVFVAWWRHHAIAASCTLSLAVTLLATSATTEWAALHSPLVSAVQSGLVFWLFAAVVVGVVWWAPNRGRSRAVTTWLAHAVLVVASMFVVLAPSSAPIAGLCGAMAVVGWRSRRRRGRAGETPAGGAADVDRAEESRGVRLTREAVSTLPSDGWYSYARWVLPEGGGVVEVLVVGPGGVFVVETRDWPGSVELVDVPEAKSSSPSRSSRSSPSREGTSPSQAYALGGDARELVARLAPSAHKVRLTAELLGVGAGDVVGLVVFWGETSVPGGVAELMMLASSGGSGGSGGSGWPGGSGRPGGSGARGRRSRPDSEDVSVFLVRGERLGGWLGTHPVRLDAAQVARVARRASAEDFVR